MLYVTENKDEPFHYQRKDRLFNRECKSKTARALEQTVGELFQ